MVMGIPGLAGIEHFGITVPNLEEAKHFFIEILGCDLVFDGGQVDPDPKFMTNNLSVSPSSKLKYSFLRCKTGPNIEIFEYTAPDQKVICPKNSDVGGHHLAFYVEDIEIAVQYLQTKNITIQGDVNFITEGPAGGSAWVYFLAPWGLQLELVSFPKGKAYEAGSEITLWHPKRPSE